MTKAIKKEIKEYFKDHYKHFKGSPTDIEEIIKTSAEPYYLDKEEFKKIISDDINNNLLQKKEIQ
jgi:hypothetical protein